MVKLTRDEANFIKANFNNPDRLLKAENINIILDAFDDLMLYEGFGPDDEPNDRGYEIEKIRDKIYMNN